MFANRPHIIWPPLAAGRKLLTLGLACGVLVGCLINLCSLLKALKDLKTAVAIAIEEGDVAEVKKEISAVDAKTRRWWQSMVDAPAAESEAQPTRYRTKAYEWLCATDSMHEAFVDSLAWFEHSWHPLGVRRRRSRRL